MNDKDKLKPSQADSFLDAMNSVKGITRHQHDRADVQSKTQKDINLKAKRDAAIEEQEKVIDHLSSEAVDIVESNDELLFAAPGIQLKVMKRLRQGHIPWEAGIDLHGQTVDDARDEVSRFIRQSRASGMRSVMIVHGKSFSHAGKQAIIKSYVNEWLRRMPGVLAFCSAQDKDGGRGAVYVLLKRES